MRFKFIVLLLVNAVRNEVDFPPNSDCTCFIILNKLPNSSPGEFTIDCDKCELRQRALFGDHRLTSIKFTNCSKAEAILGIGSVLQSNETNCVNGNHDEDFIERLVKKFQNAKEIEQIVVSDYNDKLKTPVEFFSLFKSMASINYTDNKMFDLSDAIFANSENVSKVSLSNNELTNLNENLIKKLMQLEQFDLSYNLIESLPNNFFSNSQSLKSLKMSFNKLENLNE